MAPSGGAASPRERQQPSEDERGSAPPSTAPGRAAGECHCGSCLGADRRRGTSRLEHATTLPGLPDRPIGPNFSRTPTATGGKTPMNYTLNSGDLKGECCCRSSRGLKLHRSSGGPQRPRRATGVRAGSSVIALIERTHARVFDASRTDDIAPAVIACVTVPHRFAAYGSSGNDLPRSFSERRAHGRRSGTVRPRSFGAQPPLLLARPATRLMVVARMTAPNR